MRKKESYIIFQPAYLNEIHEREKRNICDDTLYRIEEILFIESQQQN